MPAQADFRGLPPLALHMVGAQHDLVQVLHAEIGVMETSLAITARQGGIGVQKKKIMVIDGSGCSQVHAVAVLDVREAESKPVPHERSRRLEFSRLEHDVL